MAGQDLVRRVRRLSGLTQDDLAQRAETSRPTLSAYEQGRKSPSLSTFIRIADAAGIELHLVPKVTFTDQVFRNGRVASIPDRLWRLPLKSAMQEVSLPLHLNWSMPGQRFDLRQRRERGLVYEIVMTEGLSGDLLAYIDGALLVDLWDDLVLPRELRKIWQPLIDSVSSLTGGPDLGIAS